MTAKRNLKRVGALVLALTMCFAMAVSVSAADTDASTYSVTIYKSNGTDISMANDAVAGDATVTQLDSGYQIDIPIQPLYNYTVMSMFTADGYLTSATIDGATSASVVVTSANTGDRADTPYAAATLTIVVDTLPSDMTFTATTSRIDLYDVGTSDSYWMSHVSPSFVIALS